MNIITPEIITDINELNPGCDINSIFEKTLNDNSSMIEFNRQPKQDLEFRPIPSLDNRYEINENGTILRNISTGKRLSIFLDMHHSKTGYYASMINFKGITRRVMIHKAVAEAWLGPIPDGHEVDHIDRNSHNNHYTNLRYVTHSEQMKNRILSPRIIEQAKINCRKYLVECVMKPVKLIEPSGNILEFQSHTECARYLAPLLGLKVETARRLLKTRRTEHAGYKFFYVNEALRSIAA